MRRMLILLVSFALLSLGWADAADGVVFSVGRGNTPLEATINAQRNAVIAVAGELVGGGIVADNFPAFEAIFADCAALAPGVEYVDGPGLWKEDNDTTYKYITLAAKVTVNVPALEKRIETARPNFTDESGTHVFAYVDRKDDEELEAAFAEALAGFPDEYVTVSEVRDEYDDDAEELHVFFTVKLDEARMRGLIRQLDALFAETYWTPPVLLRGNLLREGKAIVKPEDRLNVSLPFEQLKSEDSSRLRTPDPDTHHVELVLDVNESSSLATRRIFTCRPPTKTLSAVQKRFKEAWVKIGVTGAGGKEIVEYKTQKLRMPLPCYGVAVFTPKLEFSTYEIFGSIGRSAFNPGKAEAEYRQTFKIDEWTAGDIEEVRVELGWNENQDQDQDADHE